MQQNTSYQLQQKRSETQQITTASHSKRTITITTRDTLRPRLKTAADTKEERTRSSNAERGKKQ